MRNDWAQTGFLRVQLNRRILTVYDGLPDRDPLALPWPLRYAMASRIAGEP
jgi:hypothetical protein